MSVNVATQKFSGNYGPWIATTTTHGTYTYSGYQSQPLNYVPSNAEYLQIRFKVTGCSVASGKTPEFCVVYDYTDAANLQTTRQTDYDAMRVEYDVLSEEYQTITIALSDAFKNAMLINNIGFRFWHVVSNGSGKIVIDYIYIGPEESLPTKALFFDFTNNTAAKNRYATSTYGGNNYDSTPSLWARTVANNSVSVTNTGLGTLNLELNDPATASNAFAQTATGVESFSSTPPRLPFQCK